MSKFLKIPDDYLSPSCFHYQALFYIIPELRAVGAKNYPGPCSKNIENSTMQLLIDESDNKLRMYGPAEELAENVKIYANCQESSKFFNTDEYPYQTNPTVFSSLKNEKYIQKTDLFIILQNMLPNSNEPSFNLFVTIFGYFLKSKEEKVNKYPEFVRYDEKILEDIEKEFLAEMKTGRNINQKQFLKSMKNVSNLRPSEVIKKFQSLYPKTWNEECKADRIQCLIDDMSNLMPMINKSNIISIVYPTLENMIKSIRKVMTRRPEMFLPHSEIKNNSMPITVRMFEDGNQRFMMKSELSNALNALKSYKGRLDSDDELNIFHTMKMEEVFQKFGDKLKNVEFIRYPIIRAKHRAVPIKSPKSETPRDFFVLAVDFLFAYLKELIFGMKIFQKVQNSNRGLFWMLFDSQHHIFLPDMKTPYFVRAELTTNLKQMFPLMLGEIVNLPAKEVRNAKDDGFTVQHLKNELKYLGLSKTFPYIRNYAEAVHAEIDRVKKGAVLRTCDLFDAIEQCVLMCFFFQLPRFQQFLHNQKGCSRIPCFYCEQCEAEKVTEHLKKMKVKESNDSKI